MNAAVLVAVVSVVAVVAVILVVVLGILRRSDRRGQQEQLASQHALGERLGPPGDHHVELPSGAGEPTYEAIDELRRHPER